MMNMKDKLKTAFDQIHAEEELKDKTRAYLAQKAREYAKPKFSSYAKLLSAAACLLFIFFGSYWMYFLPTTEISIDINPSIELGVNRLDRVISVRSYNQDGQVLADSLDVQNLNYVTAIQQIMENEHINSLLSKDEFMTIAVVSSNDSQGQQILSRIQSCTKGQTNTYCYATSFEEVADAHSLGLSYGKYRAFLSLQALDPSITPEEIQGMSMREIRSLMQSLSSNEENQTYPDSFSGHQYQWGKQHNDGQ